MQNYTITKHKIKIKNKEIMERNIVNKNEPKKLHFAFLFYKYKIITFNFNVNYNLKFIT